MGKITGFLEFERSDRDYEPVEERVQHWREFVLPLPGERDARAGRALHGLRHSLLSHRLPGQQPDPRLERSRLSRRLAGGRAQPALAPTIFPKSPAASARRRARRPARSTSTTSR